MGKNITVKDCGRIEYKEAYELQENLFNELINRKARRMEEETSDNYLLLCEHSHVFTLGKNGRPSNLLMSFEKLSALGIDFFQTNRGGDMTYHGFGQLVVYPILDLDYFQVGLREYVDKLEETVIHLLISLGIQTHRVKGASGVWIDEKNKICAIGVKSSKKITMHGLALNVNTDLSYFNYIHPCGFTDKGVTSIAKEKGKEQDFAEIKLKFVEHFLKVFGAEKVKE